MLRESIYCPALVRHLFVTLVLSVVSALTLVSNSLAATPAPTTLLVLGDSISAAYNMRPEQGWVALLDQTLPDEIKVVNASVSGETSAGALKRLPALLTNHKPDWIIVELGGNDGLRGYATAVLLQNLQTITAKATQSGSQVILIDMQIPPNYGPRYTKQFSEVYQQLAQEQQLPLVENFIQTVALNPELMQDDGVHPNEQAQPLLMQRVFDTLQQLKIAP